MSLSFPLLACGCDFPLIEVFVGRERQEFDELIVCDNFVEYLVGWLEFASGEFLLADSRFDFLKLFLGKLVV